MRFAGDIFLGVEDPEDFGGNAFSADEGLLGAEAGEIAMTPAQAKQLLGRFVSEAKRGSVTPQAFADGLYYAGEYGKSPDLIRRDIRNTLKSPVGKMAAENPELARDLAGQSLEMLSGLGINPDSMKKHMGFGAALLKQAKADGLLRDNVSVNDVRTKLQKPLYDAVQEFAVKNRKNPELNSIIRRSFNGGPKGYDPTGKPATPIEVLLGDYLWKQR